MNFSTVQVDGILEQNPRTLRNGAMLLLINDGSGTLPVFLEDNPAEMPVSDSRIVVSGIVNVGARENIRMTVESADSLIVETADRIFSGHSRGSLGDVGLELMGENITVSGHVANVWFPPGGSRAPHRIILMDDSGTLEVIHWLQAPPIISLGDLLEATGAVGSYNGKLQLKVRDASHLRSLPDA